MFVCRLRHSVVLVFPLLWSRVCIDESMDPAALLSYLELSKIVLISLSAIPEILKLFTPHCHRIKEFHLQFDRDVDLSVLNSLSSPALRLKSLSMKFNCSGNPAECGTLPKLFGGCTPHLMKLLLCPFVLAPGNTLVNLTHLRLIDQRDVGYTISHFLAMLEVSLDLEDLLMYASPYPDELRSRRLVTLKKLRLRRLVWHSWEQLQEILSHLVVPKGVSLVLKDVLEDYGEDVVSTFLEDSSRIELLRHVIKLSVIHTPDFVVLQALSEDRMSASSYTSWVGGALTFHSNMWMTLGWVLPLSHVRELWVGDAAVLLDAHIWKTTLQKMVVLEKLFLHDVPSQLPLEVLLAFVLVDGSRTPCCPRLHTLIICDDPMLDCSLISSFAHF